MVPILMGFAKPAMPQGTSHDCCALFGQFLGSEASQNKEGGGYPPPPFQIFKSKTWQFLELESRAGRHFDSIYDVFCTCLNFYIKKCSFKN